MEKHPELKCDKDKQPLDEKVARQNAMKFVPESVRAKYEKTTIKLTEEQRYFNAINKMKANKTGVPADLKMVEDLAEDEVKATNPDIEGSGKIDKKDPSYARIKEKYVDAFQINVSTPDKNGERCYPIYEDKEAKSAQDAAEKAQKKLPKKFQEGDTAKSDKWENPTMQALNKSATEHWNAGVKAREAKNHKTSTEEFKKAEVDYLHMAEVDKTSEKAMTEAQKAADEAWKKVPAKYQDLNNWKSDEYSKGVRTEADQYYQAGKAALDAKDTSSAVKQYKLAEEGYKKLAAMEKPSKEADDAKTASETAFQALPSELQTEDISTWDQNTERTKVRSEADKHYTAGTEAFNTGDYVRAAKEFKLTENLNKKLKEISGETPKKKEAIEAQTKMKTIAQKLYGEQMATETDSWDQKGERLKIYNEATRHNNEAFKAFTNYDYEKATKEYKLAEAEYKKLEAMGTVPKEVNDAEKAFQTALSGVSADWQGDPESWDKNEAYTIVAQEAWNHKVAAENAKLQQDYPKAAAEYKLATEAYKKLKPLADDWDKKNTAGAKTTEAPKETEAEKKEKEAKGKADEAKTAMDKVFGALGTDWQPKNDEMEGWSGESKAIAKAARQKERDAKAQYEAKNYTASTESYDEAAAKWQELLARKQQIEAEEAKKKNPEQGGGSGEGGVILLFSINYLPIWIIQLN